MGENIKIIAVFIEGLASFLSPCLLPLIPVYMTYLLGKAAEDAILEKKGHRRLIINSLSFVAGFILIFVLLGAAATSIGSFLLANQVIIRKISGILIVVFGLFSMGILNIKFLNYERRLNITSSTPGILSSLILGIGFGFAWTPCIGPILASVLILAGQSKTIIEGIILLLVYGLGIGLPFIAISLFYKALYPILQKLIKHAKIIKIISGFLLIIIGVLIYFNWLAMI